MQREAGQWMFREREKLGTQQFECEYFNVSAFWINQWEEMYSPLNVTGELGKMAQWLKANPRRRKKNYQRFIVGWLNKAHAQVVTAQVTSRVQAKAGTYDSQRQAPDYSKECADILERHPDLKP